VNTKIELIIHYQNFTLDFQVFIKFSNNVPEKSRKVIGAKRVIRVAVIGPPGVIRFAVIGLRRHSLRCHWPPASFASLSLAYGVIRYAVIGLRRHWPSMLKTKLCSQNFSLALLFLFCKQLFRSIRGPVKAGALRSLYSLERFPD